jgi:hypothetical protein
MNLKKKKKKTFSEETAQKVKAFYEDNDFSDVSKKKEYVSVKLRTEKEVTNRKDN